MAIEQIDIDTVSIWLMDPKIEGSSFMKEHSIGRSN